MTNAVGASPATDPRPLSLGVSPSTSSRRGRFRSVAAKRETEGSPRRIDQGVEQGHILHHGLRTGASQAGRSAVCGVRRVRARHLPGSILGFGVIPPVSPPSPSGSILGMTSLPSGRYVFNSMDEPENPVCTESANRSGARRASHKANAAIRFALPWTKTTSRSPARVEGNSVHVRGGGPAPCCRADFRRRR